MPVSLQRDVVPAAVLAVVSGLQRAGHQAFLVGGCVRDLLRGRSPDDFDVATSATPEQVQGCFRRVLPTGVAHGTVTVHERGCSVEVTTFRSEADYVDGRRPSSVAFETDVEVDLSRRDFTINAMAWDPLAARFVDPFGGRSDLAQRLVRCVRDAHARFSEDGLRALRAVRFATVLDFAIEAETERAIAPTLPVFRKVALERVNQEFSKLLVAARASVGLRLLHATGLLGTFLPEADTSLAGALDRAPPSLSVRLALLLLGRSDARRVLLRLKCSNQLADEVDHLVRNELLPDGDTATDGALRRWLARARPEHVDALVALSAARGLDVTRVGERLSNLVAARPPLSIRDLALDGRGIMQVLGVGPSAVVGDATRHLLDCVLERPELNTREALEGLLRQRFGAPGSAP